MIGSPKIATPAICTSGYTNRSGEICATPTTGFGSVNRCNRCRGTHFGFSGAPKIAKEVWVPKTPISLLKELPIFTPPAISRARVSPLEAMLINWNQSVQSLFQSIQWQGVLHVKTISLSSIFLSLSLNISDNFILFF